MRVTRFLLTFTLAAMLTASAWRSWAEEPAAPQAGLGVTLRMREDAIYPKHPLVLTMTFVNEGTKPVTLDAAAFAPERFHIIDAKGKGPGKVNPGAPTPAALRIDGMETVEQDVDLSAWYPSLTSKIRVWEISWSHGLLKPAPITVRMTRAYDRDKDRTAVVETDLGRMVWRLLPEEAPNHVKHFVDLARQGFYDGLTIYRSIPGLVAEGGDPNGDGTGGWDRMLMPEMSQSIVMKMGLVGSPRRESSPTNSFIFFITLGPNDYMSGMQTIFAEVTTGIEVVAKLHRVPSRGDTGDSRAYFLTPPVKIQKITITR